MKVSVTGPGRTGTLDQGIGRLELRTESKGEQLALIDLAEESQNGNLAFWCQLIWGVRNGKLSKRKMEWLDNTVASLQNEYGKYLNGQS